MSRPDPVEREPRLPLLTPLFLAAICAPLAWTLLAGPSKSVEEEARATPPRPGLIGGPSGGLAEFPEQFGAWWKDSFRLRRPLLKLHNAVMLFGFGDSPTTRFALGRDGWMFLRYDSGEASHRNTDPYTQEELDEVVRVYDERATWLAARDIEYLLVVAPDKHTIYPELLPDAYAPVRPWGRLDQLFGRLRERTEVPFLDLRPMLLEAKHEHLVYFPMGTHWSFTGAFLAAAATADALRPRVPSIPVLDLDAYELRTDPNPDSLAPKLFLAEELWRDVPQPWTDAPPPFAVTDYWLNRNGGVDITTEHQDASLPRVLMFNDSCAEWMRVYVALWASWLRTDAYVAFDPELVREHRPDVLVEERVERSFDRGLPAPNPLSDEELASARAWLAARPLALERIEDPDDVASARSGGRTPLRVRRDGAFVELHGLEAPAPGERLLLRAELVGEAPASIRAYWTRARIGGDDDTGAHLPIGRRWVFLELDGVDPDRAIRLVAPPSERGRLVGLAARALPANP